MKQDNRSRLGEAAEQAAAAYLEQIGYQIVVRNYRTRRGEIDLIARDGGTIVFIEVKARRGGVSPSLEAVDYRKRRRIARAAVEYLATRRLSDVAVRFDVVAVSLDKGGAPTDVHVVRDAFSVGE